MADSQQSDHWDLLASALGAEPQKKDFGESNPQSQEKTPALETDPGIHSKRDQEQNKSSSGQPRRASNWDALAFELGIEVKPQPPCPESAELSFSKHTEKKIAAIPQDLSETEIPSVERGDKRTEIKTPFQAFSEPDSEETVERKSRHHRRRRHKNKDDKKERPAAKIRESLPDSETKNPAKEDLDEMLSDVAIEMAENAGVDVIVDTEESELLKQRKKHRRSHRGLRKKKKKGGEFDREKYDDANKPDLLENEEIGSEIEAAGTFDDEQSAEEQSDQDSQRAAKSAFRSIPTWDEAVGFIIAKNMETRPKRPGSGQPRSRSSSDSRKKRR